MGLKSFIPLAITADTGTGYGLKVTLNADTRERYCSLAPGGGFKLLVHQNHEHPRMDEFSRVIPCAHTTRVIVTPFLLDADDSVRRIAIADRNCLFQEESSLEFYRYVHRHAAIPNDEIS